MGRTPCGCDLMLRADRTPDPRAAAVLRSEAADLQRLWGCPNATGTPPTGHDQRCRHAADAVARMTDAPPGSFATCPSYYLRETWMHDAVHAYRWWEKGALALICPHPSAALVDAVDVIQTALSARESDDIERMKKTHESGR